MTATVGTRVLLAVLVIVLLAGVSPVWAGELHGVVKNGTTGSVAAGVEVILLQLQGGMQPVANSKSDAQGNFTFNNAAIGAQPMLVRAVYKGVNFHQPVPPGRSDVEVSVFEPSKDPRTIAVSSRIVFFQPNGETLTVGEEYSIENHSQPPQAFYRSDGNFEFVIPENAKLQQVAVSGPAGMPVVQAPLDKKKGKYAIAYAFRPGQSTVRYSYELAYPGNTAKLKIATVYPSARLLVVGSPTLQIAGDGLQSSGQEQGMTVYTRENLAANSTLNISVSGTAPPLQNAANDAGGQAGQDAQQGSEAAQTVQQIPGRLDVLKWPLIAGFVGVFAIGAMLLARKPVVAVAGVPGMPAASANISASTPALTTSAASPSASSNGGAMASLDAAVGTSLDGLKDQLFRLELRRQAGTMSEQEYTQERAKAEKVLRDLVRG